MQVEVESPKRQDFFLIIEHRKIVGCGCYNDCICFISSSRLFSDPASTCDASPSASYNLKKKFNVYKLALKPNMKKLLLIENTQTFLSAGTV